jgi:hypothetical protein
LVPDLLQIPFANGEIQLSQKREARGVKGHDTILDLGMMVNS